MTFSFFPGWLRFQAYRHEALEGPGLDAIIPSTKRRQLRLEPNRAANALQALEPIVAIQVMDQEDPQLPDAKSKHQHLSNALENAHAPRPTG